MDGKTQIRLVRSNGDEWIEIAFGRRLMLVISKGSYDGSIVNLWDIFTKLQINYIFSREEKSEKIETETETTISQESKSIEDVFSKEYTGKLKLEDVFTPPTAKSQGTSIFVLRDKNGHTVLRWVSADKVTDEVVIIDEKKLYNLMRSKAIDNELTLVEFWHLVKSIHGFSTNKATMVFNYIGYSPKFRTKLDRRLEKYGFQQHEEWYIEFLEDEEYDEAYWRDFWKKQMIEERKVFEGILR